MIATLVCGPPCAGKNHYVEHRRRAGDLVVDVDQLYAAFGGASSHDQPPPLKPFVFAARDAVLAHLWSNGYNGGAVWIISSAPTSVLREPLRDRGCRVVMVIAEAAMLYRRADQERPSSWREYIDRWLLAYDALDVDEIVYTGNVDVLPGNRVWRTRDAGSNCARGPSRRRGVGPCEKSGPIARPDRLRCPSARVVRSKTFRPHPKGTHP
ncbi:MAG: hypothetical protein IT182_03825 [Acidobacteria bacterium]|nr:hypothetical protein [Acidobacteriota bacterium]